jgi:nucleotide-binding universal stress UspA family protein
MNRVGVLIDFSYVSEVALSHALLLSGKWLDHLYLIHICQAGHKKEAQEKLGQLKERFIDDDLHCDTQVDEGEFFDIIPTTLGSLDLDLIVVGTHGIRGISDPKYGLNIIRLIDSVETPFLIVQDHSELPENGFDQILLSILSTQDIKSNAQFLKDLVIRLRSNLTVLAILNEEDDMSHAEQAYRSYFSELKNQLVYDDELFKEMAGGFAKSILQYASIEDAKAIAIERKHEDRSLDDDEFKQILLNRQGFAILVLS